MLSDAQLQDSTTIDIDRMTERVEAAILASPPSLDFPAHAKPLLGGLSGSKVIVVGTGLVLGMALGSVWTLKKASRGVPQPPVTATQPVGADSVIPAASAPPTSESAAAPVVGSDDVRAAPAASALTNSASHDSRVSGLNEAALLDSARAALASDPRRALLLTQEHMRRFPHGALVQEREVIAIEALSRLGQTNAARSRGNEFERRYPGSAHQQKIDQTTRGQ
jgi:hypothetical protein